MFLLLRAKLKPVDTFENFPQVVPALKLIPHPRKNLPDLSPERPQFCVLLESLKVGK